MISDALDAEQSLAQRSRLLSLQDLADKEQRTVSQICELLLYEAVDVYKKEGPKFVQRLVAKQKSRAK